MTLVEWVAVLSRALLDAAGDPPPMQKTALLAESPLPLAVFRSDSYAVVLATPAWRALFGQPGEPPREVGDALAAADRSAAMQTVPELRVRDQPWRFVIQPVAFSADARGLVAACTQIVDESDLAKQEHIAMLDRLLVALNEAETANRAKDNFLATVSHELRAPVTTIMLWENVLRDHLDDPPLRVRALDAIRESAAAQARLVGDLLDISRAISGRLRLELRRTAIENVVAAAVDAALPAATAKQVAIDAVLRPRLGRVLADPARLRQVFDNLLSNAIKFTPPGGRITVEARRERSAIVITVTDTGAGIDEPLLRRLFTPFVRHEEAPARAENGLGLGLAIAKQLVDMHEGTLTASSEGRDRGSTFKVTLPLAQRRASTPVPGNSDPLQRLDGVRVLVVDDEPRVREGLELLLNRVGATVGAAASATEARELLERIKPDVLVCDISMPGEDGYTFIRSLRSSDSSRRRIPAIALTAYATQRDRDRAAAAGFDAHLAKPVQLQALASEIQHLLARG